MLDVWQGQELLGTYKNNRSPGYLDAIGGAVCELVTNIPHGVLCFFPSYTLLDSAHARWKETGLWSEILQHKYIMKEPKLAKEFDDTLKEYEELIAKSKEGTGKGVLLCAVCRGKVSEGMDFRDEQARGIVVVSIPYPNLKDLQVCAALSVCCVRR